MVPLDFERERRLVLDQCICTSCPSWVEGGNRGRCCLPDPGRSRRAIKELGCICGGCPVTEKLGLKYDYFCTRGSEAEQAAR